MPELTSKRSVSWDFRLELREGDEPWPDMTKMYGSTVFRPMHLYWSVENGKFRRLRIVGSRVLKDGTLGVSMSDDYWNPADIPLWAWSLMDEATEGMDLDA